MNVRIKFKYILIAVLFIRIGIMPFSAPETVYSAPSFSIYLSWTASTDNVGVTGYKIYRDGLQIGTSVTNSYTDTDLPASQTYIYTVSAYDAAANNSAQASPVSITTGAEEPTAVTYATPPGRARSEAPRTPVLNPPVSEPNEVSFFLTQIRSTQEDLDAYISKIVSSYHANPYENLHLGMMSEDVRELQKFLNQLGFFVARIGAGSPGNETRYFGFLTRDALIRFQKGYSIVPAVGYFGPVTRQFIESLRLR